MPSCLCNLRCVCVWLAKKPWYFKNSISTPIDTVNGGGRYTNHVSTTTFWSLLDIAGMISLLMLGRRRAPVVRYKFGRLRLQPEEQKEGEAKNVCKLFRATIFHSLLPSFYVPELPNLQCCNAWNTMNFKMNLSQSIVADSGQQWMLLWYSWLLIAHLQLSMVMVHPAIGKLSSSLPAQ